ncbi:hypothetical protein C9374_013577 [Naegleria lovaniensis]|uniref:G-patch domain-containing protein n=1 Tax=Naegleria lovaniensis TaxID=51637 RepID=A0AA88KQ98_NAELO|nr:uncharacterized protein C9374_013577 [Naegleria lovaniensis]KAG2392092.1 hypothetical protein C9374_013577 [Naegleria lovaniensis]
MQDNDENNTHHESTTTDENSKSEMNEDSKNQQSSALDELFSSSSEDEESKPTTLENSFGSKDQEDDYMNDKFLQLTSEQDDSSTSSSNQKQHTKLSFYNAPPDLLKQYNIAKKEKQHKKAHHLKKQIREFGLKENMLEKAKISLSQNLIKKEEEKSESSQSVGLKLLKKMGYEAGQGLGKNNQGLINPLSIDRQLDDLIQSSALGKSKILPKIGSNYEELQKKEQIEQFKQEMKEKSVAQQHQSLTPEEFQRRMKEIHDEQKKKRKLRMALQPSNDVEENPLKKQKEEENWDEFDDF